MRKHCDTSPQQWGDFFERTNEEKQVFEKSYKY